jgi:hypothetical protein
LIGCQTRTDKVPKIDLPKMPLITDQAKKEIKQVCVPRMKCDNFNNWLNELYAFSIKYNIYRENLD